MTRLVSKKEKSGEILIEILDIPMNKIESKFISFKKMEKQSLTEQKKWSG